MTTKAPLADPVDIGKAASAAFLRLPEVPSVFRRRAARFGALASGHPLGGFLRFMGRLAEAQAEAVRALTPGGLPDASEIAEAKESALPPLGGDGLLDGPQWRDVLRSILNAFAAADVPDETRRVVAMLAAEPSTALDDRARAILSGDVPEAERGAAVFVTAALQVRWAGAASLLPAEGFQPIEDGRRCPVCASAPQTSVIGPVSEGQNTRYLHCGLCAAAWNYVRIKCAACGSTAGIAYHGIDGADQSIRAETCDECHAYVKIVSAEKDPAVDPMADDIASTGLDLMVAEAGWHRPAPNPFLLAG